MFNSICYYENANQNYNEVSPHTSEIIVVQSLSHVRLCNLMDCSTPGIPALHHLAELAQTHVH